MREVPLGENAAALEWLRRLRAGTIDVAIFLTGVGTRLLVQAIAEEMPAEELAAKLEKVFTVVRGPKPRAALRELGVTPRLAVPEPNTWRELLAALDASLDLAGRRVSVQEYGQENPELLSGLAERGADVLRVPIYRWALPEDLGPIREAIRRIRSGKVDVALFTSATQVEHLFTVAGEKPRELARALESVCVVSIGPICSEALEHRNVKVDLEPEHPKMGQLVLAAAERAADILAAKRQRL